MGVAGTAGCGRLDSTIEGPGITEWAFETGRPRDGRDWNQPPTVAFGDERGRVVVRGHGYYGSSSCREARLDRIAHDPDADRLRIEVGHGTDGWLPSFGCTADVAGPFYRLRACTSRGRRPGRRRFRGRRPGRRRC